MRPSQTDAQRGAQAVDEEEPQDASDREEGRVAVGR